MKRQWGRVLALGALVAACLLVVGTSRADEFIYGNNATFGDDIISEIDVTNGTVVNNYDVLAGGGEATNGRGVVLVGSTMYFTTAGSNNVYAYDLNTNTTSVVFSVAGATGLSTMAYDGTNFWIGDYSGTNNVYEYTPTGTLLNTVSLADCTGHCDGLEYLAANGGELISNEGDAVGPYDLYNLSGTLLQSAFITPQCGGGGSTGVAFDGTDFWVSCIYSSSLEEFDANGNYITTVTFTGDTSSNGPLVEDLSANYQQVLNIGAPEPSALLMLGLGLAALALFRKKYAAGSGVVA